MSTHPPITPKSRKQTRKQTRERPDPTIRTRSGHDVPMQVVRRANAELRRMESDGEMEELLEEGREFLAAHRLGQHLHGLRTQQGLTLDQLADRCGISKANLSRLESGKTDNPTLNTLTRIVVALGARVEIVGPPA